MTHFCYCCDVPATTDEHVPPQCLFPAAKDLPVGVDLRKNLITVPSCPEHNQSKSGDDEYLMYVLSMNLPVNAIAEHHFSTKVWRAIDRRPALVNRMLASSKLALVRDPKTGEIFESAQLDIEEDRIYRSFELIVLGLYRHHFSARWKGRIRVLPEFMRFADLPHAAAHNTHIEFISAKADQLFRGCNYYGENPEVFRYQLFNEQGSQIVMRLHFYEGARVLAFFESGEDGSPSLGRTT